MDEKSGDNVYQLRPQRPHETTLRSSTKTMMSAIYWAIIELRAEGYHELADILTVHHDLIARDISDEIDGGHNANR